MLPALEPGGLVMVSDVFFEDATHRTPPFAVHFELAIDDGRPETRLRIEGMTPVKCPGGREALALIGQEPFDVAILADRIREAIAPFTRFVRAVSASGG